MTIFSNIINHARKIRRKNRIQGEIRRYLNSGRVPWSPGYFAFRENFIKTTLNDVNIRHRFNSATDLPEGFGCYLDERVVELPFILSHLPQVPGKLLDAGSGLNFEYLLEDAQVKIHSTTITTLSPETSCFWYKGISYLFADLRALPLKDQLFDAVVCISTLEHVGLDNSIYAVGQDARPSSPGDFRIAIRELHRVLKPGGCCIVSVPFGIYQSFGWFQQFDSAHVEQLIEAFSPQKFTECYYRYLQNGWQISTREDCGTCRYNNDSMSKIDLDNNHAVAASAVALIMLWKGE